MTKMDDAARQQLADAINGRRFGPGQVGWMGVEEMTEAVWPVVARLCEQARHDEAVRIVGGIEPLTREKPEWIEVQGYRDLYGAGFNTAVEQFRRVARGETP